MQPGDKVRLIANPGRIGILGNETDGPAHRLRLLVNFLDGDEQFVLAGALEKVEKESLGPYDLMARGRTSEKPSASTRRSATATRFTRRRTRP